MKVYIKNILYITLLTGIFTSCFKEDKIINISPPNQDEADTVVLGNTYNVQVWVDLNGLEEKAKHAIDSWDLAFSCDPNSFDIRLNSARFMYAGTSGEKEFENVISDEGVEMLFDASSGNRDSLAIGDWYQMTDGAVLSSGYVYVINRGFDANLNEMGFIKAQFFIDEQDYIVRYANLDGSDEQNISIAKDDAYNYVHLSFANQIVPIEPPKDQWTLLFSRYSTILFTSEGDPYDYNLVGVLLNPYKVLAAETSTVYENIQLADTVSLQFTKRADVIGWDWKDYNFEDGSYVLLPDKNYVIKDKDGFFYKMRFINFYDLFGNKGNIAYELIRL
jgi:hypothetical protein